MKTILFGLFFFLASCNRDKAVKVIMKPMHSNIVSDSIAVTNEEANESRKYINRYDNSKLHTLTLITDKIFPNHLILDYAFNDIVGDKKIDAVIVLERECLENDLIATSSSKCRSAIIFKGVSEDSFIVIAENRSIISCSDCGSGGGRDPYCGLETSNGEISFCLDFGQYDRTIFEPTFSYIDTVNNWVLTKLKIKSFSWRTNDTDSIETTIRDFGVITFDKFEDIWSLK